MVVPPVIVDVAAMAVPVIGAVAVVVKVIDPGGRADRSRQSPAQVRVESAVQANSTIEPGWT
jgi:hypothetical protein